MKRVIGLLLAVLLLPSYVLAQSPPFIRNNSAASSINGANLSPGSAAVSVTGQLFCSASGDATSLGKAEDAAHTSGDMGIAAWGVRDDGSVTTFGANGDYTPLSVNAQGTLHTALIFDSGPSDDVRAIHREDAASIGADAGILSLFVREDALTLSTNASGDYVTPKTDAVGRTIITSAPAGETWQSCGTATAVTTDVAIKAAVASNRIYVTSIQCKNTSSTTGSNMDFKDGSTVIAVGSIGEFTIAAATNSSNYFALTFPIPLRGTVNTAFNFATNTAVSSVTCCAQGYISVG